MKNKDSAQLPGPAPRGYNSIPFGIRRRLLRNHAPRIVWKIAFTWIRELLAEARGSGFRDLVDDIDQYLTDPAGKAPILPRIVKGAASFPEGNGLLEYLKGEITAEAWLDATWEQQAVRAVEAASSNDPILATTECYLAADESAGDRDRLVAMDTMHAFANEIPREGECKELERWMSPSLYITRMPASLIRKVCEGSEASQRDFAIRVAAFVLESNKPIPELALYLSKARDFATGGATESTRSETYEQLCRFKDDYLGAHPDVLDGLVSNKYDYFPEDDPIAVFFALQECFDESSVQGALNAACAGISFIVPRRRAKWLNKLLERIYSFWEQEGATNMPT